MENVTIRMSEELIEQVGKRAVAEGRTDSEIIREAVTAFLGGRAASADIEAVRPVDRVLLRPLVGLWAVARLLLWYAVVTRRLVIGAGTLLGRPEDWEQVVKRAGETSDEVVDRLMSELLARTEDGERLAVELARIGDEATDRLLSATGREGRDSAARDVTR